MPPLIASGEESRRPDPAAVATPEESKPTDLATVGATPEDNKVLGHKSAWILRISVVTVILVLLAFLAHASDLPKATLTTTIYPYDGSAAIPAGANVEFLLQDGSNTHIRYAGREYIVPSWTVSRSNPEFPGMLVVLGGLALLLVIVGIVTFANAKSRAAKKALYEKLTNELHEYTETAKKSNALPTVSTDVFLKSVESAFYNCPSSLFETRAVRQYQAGHVGFRVAKGVWVGGTQGQSVSNQEWSKIDDGTLTITNMRVIFNGTQGSRNIVLNKIISVQSFVDGLEVAVENRQKNLILTAPNPYIAATIVRALRETGLGEPSVQAEQQPR
jgi:hypothetical protein